MKKRTTLRWMGLATAALLALAGCSPAPASPSASTSPSTITVQSQVGGAVTVPVSPKRVVVLDSTLLEAIGALGVEPGVIAGVVKEGSQKLVPQYAGENSTAVKDVAGAEWGTVDLEAIDALKPDLIITGWRFGAAQLTGITDLKVPLIELTNGNHTEQSLRETTTTLGQIFDKKDAAASLITAFEESVQKAKGALAQGNGIVVLSSGGSLFGSGAGKDSRHRIYYDTFGMMINPTLEQAVAQGEQHGAELTSEAILAANPDWIIVIDRDASYGVDGEFTPARQVLNNELINQTSAAQKGQIVYIDPVEGYLGEGIVTYTHAAQLIAQQAS